MRKNPPCQPTDDWKQTIVTANRQLNISPSYARWVLAQVRMSILPAWIISIRSLQTLRVLIYFSTNFVISTFRAVDVGPSQKRCFIYSFSAGMIISIQSVRLYAYTPCFTAFRVVVTVHVLSTWLPSTVLRGTYAFHSVQRYCDNAVCISSSWTTDTQFNASQTLCSLDIVRRRLRVGGAQSTLRVISELLLFFFFNEHLFFSLRVFGFHRILKWPRIPLGTWGQCPFFLFWDRIVGYKIHYATAVILPDSDRHIESLGFWELFDWILLSRPIIYLY